MQHEFDVEIQDSQSYISFRHEGIGYVIYQSVNTEPGEPIESHNLQLAEVVIINGVNRASGTAKVIESINNFITNKSSALEISETFRIAVNEYFASLGGGDNSFPVDGSHWAQYDWIVGTGFSFNNGVLTLSV